MYNNGSDCGLFALYVHTLCWYSIYMYVHPHLNLYMCIVYRLLYLLSSLQAIHLNLTTDNHLWIFPAWYPTNWWSQTVTIKNGEVCTPEMVMHDESCTVHVLVFVCISVSGMLIVYTCIYSTCVVALTYTSTCT